MCRTVIIDRHFEDRHFLSTLLTLFGHQTVLADNPIVGASLVSEHKPSLIITEALMREMDGYELVRDLRSKPGGVDIPVIFNVPACYTEQAAAVAKSLDRCWVISKPQPTLSIVQTVYEARSTGLPRDLARKLERFEQRRLPVPIDRINIKASVYVVDNDPATVRRLSVLLGQAGCDVKGFTRAENFVDQYRDEPGCLLLDVDLLDMSGLDVIEALRAQRYSIPTIILSNTCRMSDVQRALRLHSLDYLQKTVAFDTLIARVFLALQIDSLRRIERAKRENALAGLSKLSVRENEFLALLANGLTSKMIAHKLGLRIKTVANHRAHVLAKTNAANVADLVRMRMLAAQLSHAGDQS